MFGLHFSNKCKLYFFLNSSGLLRTTLPGYGGELLCNHGHPRRSTPVYYIPCCACLYKIPQWTGPQVDQLSKGMTTLREKKIFLFDEIMKNKITVVLLFSPFEYWTRDNFTFKDQPHCFMLVAVSNIYLLNSLVVKKKGACSYS